MTGVDEVAGGDTEAAGAGPVLRVVSGRPTNEELAALVAVLSTVSSGEDAPPAPAPSRWSAPGARLRTAYGPSRGGWRASGLPR